MKTAFKYASNWQLLVVSAVMSCLVSSSAAVYFLPLAIAWGAKKKLSSVTEVTTEGKAPLNQISHTHRLATSDDRVIVRPNNDTFYSSAWLDLSSEPVVVSVPVMAERYYSMQFMDDWTNVFAYIGKRATGNDAGTFLVIGPHWHGATPSGMQTIKAPSNTVWVIGRTMVYGQDDVAAVSALQAQITVTSWRPNRN